MITSTERSAGHASMASVESMSVSDLIRQRLDPDDPWELALVQRHLVWDEVRMARLLDSLLAGYPIGSLLVCRVQQGGHSAASSRWGSPQRPSSWRGGGA